MQYTGYQDGYKSNSYVYIPPREVLHSIESDLNLDLDNERVISKECFHYEQEKSYKALFSSITVDFPFLPSPHHDWGTYN